MYTAGTESKLPVEMTCFSQRAFRALTTLTDFYAVAPLQSEHKNVFARCTIPMPMYMSVSLQDRMHSRVYFEAVCLENTSW